MEQKNTPLVGIVIAIGILILGIFGFVFSNTQNAELDSAALPENTASY